MRPVEWLVCSVLLLGLAAGEASAQEDQPSSGVTTDVEAIRATLLAGLQAHRRMDVEFTRAIPDSALRCAPTPGVRDFAQQIDHATMAVPFFMARAVLDVPVPSFGDSARYLNDKAALERAVEAAYDWAIERLRDLPAEELLVETELFGQRLTKWRVCLQALAHGDWTRGQLVPYFRLHGVEPPGWRSY